MTGAAVRYPLGTRYVVGLPPQPRGRLVIARSCNRCGEFKDAHMFPRSTGPRMKNRSAICQACVSQRTHQWRDGHKAEFSEHVKRNQGRRQTESLPLASRRGYVWTGPELEILARTDLTLSEMATMIGRTFHAVRRMRRLMKTDPRKINLAGISEGKSA